jgi:hypothetical protein
MRSQNSQPFIAGGCSTQCPYIAGALCLELALFTRSTDNTFGGLQYWIRLNTRLKLIFKLTLDTQYGYFFKKLYFEKLFHNYMFPHGKCHYDIVRAFCYACLLQKVLSVTHMYIMYISD